MPFGGQLRQRKKSKPRIITAPSNSSISINALTLGIVGMIIRSFFTKIIG
jgi:hypothetical protein